MMGSSATIFWSWLRLRPNPTQLGLLEGYMGPASFRKFVHDHLVEPQAYYMAFRDLTLEHIRSLLNSFPAEYRLGMTDETRTRILGDSGASAPANWGLEAPNNEPLHALLILNAQSGADLAVWCGEQRRLLQDTAGADVEQVHSTQYGTRPASGTEHFGFFDGVAQPQIEGIKGKGIRTGEFIFGYQNEYGFFPAGPVVPAAEDGRRILLLRPTPFIVSLAIATLGCTARLSCTASWRKMWRRSGAL